MSDPVTWIFLITLFMPSFGGEVEFRGKAADEASCNKLRKVVAERMVSMSSNGVISPACYPLTPVKGPVKP